MKVRKKYKQYNERSDLMGFDKTMKLVGLAAALIGGLIQAISSGKEIYSLTKTSEETEEKSEENDEEEKEV